MIRIFTRSPHILSVNNVSQTGSKVELYIYDGASSGPPTQPTYTLSKLIPATGVTENLYNISPYLKEYLKHKSNGMNYNTVNDLTEYDEYTYVQYKTYNLIGGTYYLDQTVTARCYDGYGYFEELTNVDRGDILLGDGTKHYYWYDSTNTPASIGAHRAGIVTAFMDRDWSVYRQNLLTGASQINTYTLAGVYDLYRVFPLYYGSGNLMQIFSLLVIRQLLLMHLLTVRKKQAKARLRLSLLRLSLAWLISKPVLKRLPLRKYLPNKSWQKLALSNSKGALLRLYLYKETTWHLKM